MATVTIQVDEALEKKLQVRAAEQGRDVASVALDLVEQGMQTPAPRMRTADELTPEERWQAFREYIEEVNNRPGIDVVIDVSRESIYEGCGE